MFIEVRFCSRGCSPVFTHLGHSHRVDDVGDPPLASFCTPSEMSLGPLGRLMAGGMGEADEEGPLEEAMKQMKQSGAQVVRVADAGEG